MIGGHGNDWYRYGDKVRVDFSSNVAARNVPAELLQFLKTQLDAVSVYPEPDSESLRRALAEKHETTASRVIITNGSVEAFYIIAAAFRASRSLIFTPSFSEYEDACRMHSHTLLFKNNALLHESSAVRPQLVWLGNPNNPDGRLYSVEALREQIRKNSGTVFVVDEAYGGLCSGFESAVGLLAEYNNLIVVRSMTKNYALPGLRLGYVLTSRELAAQLLRFCIPWSVNALAQRVGLYLVRNEALLSYSKKSLLRSSVALQNRFRELADVEVVSSPCNFFMMRMRRMEAPALKEYLLQNFGYLIRDASNFHGLDRHCVRIAVQADEENEQLFEAVRQINQSFTLLKLQNLREL